jgi:S1-C subfamily serine protease
MRTLSETWSDVAKLARAWGAVHITPSSGELGYSRTTKSQRKIMKLTTQRMLGFQTLCLRAFLVILSLVLATTAGIAQESTQVDEFTKPADAPADSAKPTAAKAVQDPKVLEAVQALSPSIVTVTRIDPKTGLPSPNPNVQAGILVDSRGYILTPLVVGLSKAKPFKVRLANLQESVAEVSATDESLKLMILKIPTAQPLPAVSLAKIREPREGDSVFVVPSPAAKGLISGRITATAVNLSDADSTKVIQTDIKFPLGEGGSLLVSELGEPIGIPYAIRAGEQPMSFALPLKVALRFIQSATNADVTDEAVAAPPLPAAEAKIPDIIGTWSRAESGTFSKLTIWPVENHVLRVFVEGADGNGLLEWVPARSQFLGAFTFNALGNRSVDALLAMGSKDTTRLYLKPADDLRKQLLRSGFAKTERELDQKLSSDWTRVEAPVRPMPTVTVVKTEFEPSRIRELLHAKYRAPHYHFFSNDTFRSVIVRAPAEAQEDIEVLIHKLDVKEESSDQAASPNIAQQSPANQPQASSRRPDEGMPDITGTWGPLGQNEVVIRRAKNGEADFEMTTRLLPRFKKSDPYAEDTPPRRIKWFPEAQHFQTLDPRNRGIATLTMKPNADGKSMHVTMTINGKPVDERYGKNSGEMEWTRTESNPSIVDGTDSADARDPSDLASTPPAQKMRVYELQFVSPKEFETALQKLFQGRVQRITIDQRTNSVIIFAEPAVLAEVDVLSQVLDGAPSRKPLLDGSRLDALPDTPAAKQLVAQLQAQESAAAADAATIRQLQASGQVEQNKQPIAEHQRKLKNLLSTAFDLKLQLEELQVKELQSRLSRLERQIGQRKELREKIIARRATELIEGEGLRWDSAGDNTKTQGVTATKSKTTAQGAQAFEPSVMMTQIGFVGPSGMQVLIDGAKRELIAPVSHDFRRHAREVNQYYLRLLKAPVFPDVPVFGLLEIDPVTSVADEFLRHNKIPLTITDEDIKQVSSANVLIKVAYLAEPSEKRSRREVEMLVSSRLDPGTNPIEEANRRGEILAVLRLAANDELLGISTADASTPKADQIVIDLYGGSQVLPGLGKNPGYSQLVQSLNALKGVKTNFREIQAGDATTIVMAIVRDPSQRCQQETRQTQKESELRIAINSALKAAGIKETRWDENSDAEETSADEPVTSKTSRGVGSNSGSGLSGTLSAPTSAAGMGTRVTNPPPAARPKELEFLSQYPRFSSLSLAMTETQFRAFLEQQKLAPQLSIPRDGQLNYSVPLGDGNRLTVMFGLDGKCRGIERISGAAPSPILPHPASPAPVRAERVVAKIFRLEQVDAASVAKTLQELASEKPFSARISADATSNSVIVFANPEDMPVIEAIVIRLDKAPDPPSPKAAPQPGSDSSATPAIPGTSNASRPKPDQIVIDLFGAPWTTKRLAKKLGDIEFLGSLNALPGVVTNSVEGDDFVLAIVRDPSLRCQRETQRTRKESELRLAINSVLKAGGILSVHWEEGSREGETQQSKADGKDASLDPLELRDQILIDLYGGSQVLPGLGKNPGYSKLVQSLNALKGVTVNFREAGKGDAIVMAMIHDPSLRCQREAQQTLKESELRVAINSALKAAGIQSSRWEENAAAAEVEKVEGNSASTPKADQIVIDLYGGSGVLWGLSKNPNHSKLIQNLNALSGVVTNFRIADEGTAIAIAIVRDPSQRCLSETQRTQKESELRVAINSALKAAGIEATRWDENSDGERKGVRSNGTS